MVWLEFFAAKEAFVRGCCLLVVFLDGSRIANKLLEGVFHTSPEGLKERCFGELMLWNFSPDFLEASFCSRGDVADPGSGLEWVLHPVKESAEIRERSR